MFSAASPGGFLTRSTESEAYQVSHRAQVLAPDDTVLQGVSAVTINHKQTGYGVIRPVSGFAQPLLNASPKSALHVAAHTTTAVVPAVLDG